MDRPEVYKLIDGERDYQDSRIKDGTYKNKVHTVGEEILMINAYASRAMQEWTSGHSDAEGLEVVRKIAGLAVRCMENHKTSARKP